MTIVLWIISVLASASAAYFAVRAARLHTALLTLEAAQRASLETDRADIQRLETRLETLNREYDALLIGCGAGVLILDYFDVIERANLSAGHLLGAPMQTLVGRSLLQATLSSELNNLVKTAREQNGIQRREVRGPGINGNTLNVSVLPVPGERPGKSRLLLIAQDVTELRRLEVIRRDFVANVSHELRTPLTSIRAIAETLQDGALKDPTVAEHFLNTINTEAQRLTRISEDLLILSQAESQVPERAPFHLSQLLNDVVNRFQPQAEKNKQSLCVEAPTGLEVIAHHDQIEQVLVNLVDNALKYTPAGGQIRVTAERHPDGIAVHVADTGIGIMSQDVPRIFERFYRVDKARSRQSGGTGLGLSIVKHIVEAHGGQVTVESEYNRGSTFTFTLPV